MKRIFLLVLFMLVMCGCTREYIDPSKPSSVTEETTEKSGEAAGAEEDRTVFPTLSPEATKEDETTESEKIYELQIGIYLLKDSEGKKFIQFDDYNVTFWDTGKFDNGQPQEHYKEARKYNYYDQYYYSFNKNTVEVCSDKWRTEIEFTLNIIDEKTIEYDGKLYVYDRKFLADSNNCDIQSTGYAQYDEIIAKLTGIALSAEAWNPEAYEKQNISKAWYSTSTRNHGGYFLTDLDKDGIPEMLLGENGVNGWTGVIYDIYTIKDGKAVKLATGDHKNNYKICDDCIMMSKSSTGVMDSYYGYYKVVKGEMVLQKGVIYYDPHFNGTAPWYVCDDELTVESGTSISENEARKIIDGYKVLPIEFTLFYKY